jgi:circadian clock protein KaiC
MTKPSKRTKKTRPTQRPPDVAARETVDLQRIPTAIPRLDYILKGGFVHGGTYAILGPPGSGKTILANQACFGFMRSSPGSCVYVTLLAETHSKMLSHLATLTFFDPRAIPDRLTYFSGYKSLLAEGLPGLLGLIRKTMKDRRPALLVIDGLQAVKKSVEQSREFDDFLHELQAFAHVSGCTVLLLGTVPATADAGDLAVVDGVVELSYQLVGPRAVRELTVHKFRGTNYLLGRHEVEITRDGIQIHPRTEIQFDDPPERASEERVKMAFGVPRLDEMLGGGLMSGTATTLLGSPGTGKTMLGLAFLVEGARRGERGVYFGFYEPPPRLIDKAERVGIPLRRFVSKGLIELIWQPPLEHYMDSLAEQLLEKVRSERDEHSTEKRRLFIDGIEGFRAAAVYMDRMPRFLSAFMNQLRMLDVTTLVTEELDLFRPEVEMPNPEVATISEGVILLRYVEVDSNVRRLISILKMRESEYDTSIRHFSIGNDGLQVGDPFSGVTNLMSGSARVLPDAPAPKKRGRRR